MLLSVLIPTLDSRNWYLDRLLKVLKPQLTNDVELLVFPNDGSRSIGNIRQEMITKAQGEYLCFVDDDDLVGTQYVPAILKALAEKPDCVGFLGTKWLEGTFVGYLDFNREHDWYLDLASGKDEWRFVRPITHLCPVKAELARQVGFKDKTEGEDCDYADRLRPLLKSQVFIDKTLYHYFLRNKGPKQ